MVAASVYMSGTCVSDVLSSVGDVLEMSLVRGVGGVCDGRGGKCWGERIVFGLYQSWRNMGKLGYVTMFWLRWCWGGGSVKAAWALVWEGVMSVCVVSLDYLC